MKFRKKPVEIEAYQVFQTNFDAAFEKKKREERNISAFRGSLFRCDVWFSKGRDNVVKAKIRTLEGDMRLSDGDWIIKDIKDEFYPCKPDIFEATYEEI